MKKFKITVKLFLFTILMMPFYAFCEDVYVGGENIGINIQMNGVLVIGTYQVNNEDQAKNAGIKKGDIILKVDNQKISSIKDLITSIDKKQEVTLSIKRDNELLNIKLPIVKEDDTYKTGLYIKDSITGIGTLSFITKDMRFAALGHEISDSNTGVLLEVKDGKIFTSTVTSIDRSIDGTPGSKNASLHMEEVLGDILKNKENGIYGTYKENIENKEILKTAQIDDIKLGPAKIRTVVSNDKIEEYEIEIVKVNKKTIKNILFKIKDKKLLEKTGGIVQGMSGSPIIQGEYMIGAVTHVVVNHPDMGYGIFIGNMLEEAKRDE